MALKCSAVSHQLTRATRLLVPPSSTDGSHYSPLPSWATGVFSKIMRIMISALGLRFGLFHGLFSVFFAIFLFSFFGFSVSCVLFLLFPPPFALFFCVYKLICKFLSLRSNAQLQFLLQRSRLHLSQLLQRLLLQTNLN